MLRAAFNTARGAGLLPAFSWVVLAAALAAGAGGTWLGVRWERGAQAIVDNAALKAQAKADRQYIDDLQDNGKKLQKAAVDFAQAQGEAVSRQGEIAARMEDALDANHAFNARQQGALADLLARRPDLRDLRLGDDVLRHWNDGNAGRPAAAAPAPAGAGPGGKPAPKVPAAAGGAKRPGAGSAGQPRPGRDALPRLQRPHGQPAAVDRRVGANGAGLVLRCTLADGLVGCAMSAGMEVRLSA